MTDRDPIEYKGKVLDKRGNLTGPDDSRKAGYPKRPKHVTIEQPDSKDGQ